MDETGYFVWPILAQKARRIGSEIEYDLNIILALKGVSAEDYAQLMQIVSLISKWI